MSLNALASIIGERAQRPVPMARAASAKAASSSKQLLKSAGAYIPTEVSALYIPIAAGIAASKPPITNSTRFWIVVGGAALSAFAAWVLGHGRATKAAGAKGSNPPNAWKTLKRGWYEILASAVAFFAWGTAIPSSWYDFRSNQTWLPAALVATTAAIVGGIATLLNRATSS